MCWRRPSGSTAASPPGTRSRAVKHNRQVPAAHPAARRLGDLILTALDRTPLFMSAALPLKVVPPLFNRYEGGETYGNHIDGAIYPVAGTPHRVRTDLSATLFLSAPEDYDGGELVADDTYGSHRIKLPAGDMILYPGHEPAPGRAGHAAACGSPRSSGCRAWCAPTAQRALLFDLDTAIQSLSLAVPDDPALAQLTNVYHNLLRQWADT